MLLLQQLVRTDEQLEDDVGMHQRGLIIGFRVEAHAVAYRAYVAIGAVRGPGIRPGVARLRRGKQLAAVKPCIVGLTAAAAVTHGVFVAYGGRH